MLMAGFEMGGELTAFGPTFTDKSRSTFSDGTCTFTVSSSGDQRQARGEVPKSHDRGG